MRPQSIQSVAAALANHGHAAHAAATQASMTATYNHDGKVLAVILGVIGGLGMLSGLFGRHRRSES
jgi:hypothetical protein